MAHITLLFSVIVSALKRKRTLLIAFIILTLLAILRYDFGNDYASYRIAFDKIHMGWSSPFEDQILFNFLNAITPNFYLFIAITSVLTIYPVYKLLSLCVEEKYAWIGVLVYCINPYLFLMSLSAIRQSVATGMFIVACYFGYKRKPIPYLIIVLLASLVHASAIILLPFYFIANDRKMGKVQVLIIITVFLILLVSGDVFNDLMEKFIEMFDNTQYEHYVEEGDSNSLRATLLSSIFFVYVAINVPRLKGAALASSKLYLIGCICSVLAFRLSMLTRVQMYFDIFSIVSIPLIIKSNLSNEHKPLWIIINRYVFPILIFTIYVLRYYSFFTNPLWEAFTEYHTILEVLL